MVHYPDCIGWELGTSLRLILRLEIRLNVVWPVLSDGKARIGHLAIQRKTFFVASFVLGQMLLAKTGPHHVVLVDSEIGHLLKLTLRLCLVDRGAVSPASPGTALGVADDLGTGDSRH